MAQTKASGTSVQPGVGVIGGKSKAPAPPDYTPIIQADQQAAQLQSQTSAQQLAWAKQQFAANQQEINPLIQQETQASQQQNEMAQAANQRYNSVEVPLQDQLVTEAKQYSNPAFQQQMAGTAISNANQGFQGARNQAQQQLTTYGANPGTGRSQAANQQLSAQQAAAAGAAGTASTQTTRNTGLGLQAQAEGMLAGLPAQAQAGYNGANASGSTASGNALGLTSSGAATEGTAAQYAGLASNSLNSWGNTLSSSYNATLSRYEYDASIAEAQAQEEGQAFGAVMGALAKGGPVRGYAHGGMAIPDQLAKGGPTGTYGGQGAIPMETPMPMVFGANGMGQGYDDGGVIRPGDMGGMAGVGGMGNMGLPNMGQAPPPPANPQNHGTGMLVKMMLAKGGGIPMQDGAIPAWRAA